MKKLAIALAVGVAAVLSGSAANAADNTVKAESPLNVTQQSTDISSRGRHYRVHRHYGYRAYRPRYGHSYGYYQPRAYYGGGYGHPYYGRGYGYGGPSISFGFGGGPGWY